MARKQTQSTDALQPDPQVDEIPVGDEDAASEQSSVSSATAQPPVVEPPVTETEGLERVKCVVAFKRLFIAGSFYSMEKDEVRNLPRYVAYELRNSNLVI